MGAPLQDEVVRRRFSHGAAPAHQAHRLHVPTTYTIHGAASISPSCTVTSAWRYGVVGRFLHVSSVYFFDPLGTGNYRKQS